MANKSPASPLKPGTAETDAGRAGIKSLTRRGYKRLAAIEKQIAGAIALDGAGLTARAQCRDEAIKSKTVSVCNAQTLKELRTGHCGIPGGAAILDRLLAKARLAARIEEAKQWKPLECQQESHHSFRSPICRPCQRMARWEERLAALEKQKAELESAFGSEEEK